MSKEHGKKKTELKQKPAPKKSTELTDKELDKVAGGSAGVQMTTQRTTTTVTLPLGSVRKMEPCL